jgi:hypothetical protein
MVDIQLKILDVQAAKPLKHSLYLKNDAEYLKKVWPGTQITTISDNDVSSLNFMLKIGTNSIGEIPVTDFTKDWIQGSKEIHGYRINLAYRLLLRKSFNSDENLNLQQKLKESQNSCKILNEKLKKLENNSEILDLYTQALEKFKEKEKKLTDRIKTITDKKKVYKNQLDSIKNHKDKLENDLWLIKEELQLEKLKTKYGENNNLLVPTIEEPEIKPEGSFRFSFGPEGGSEDYQKNLESVLSDILYEKNIEENILQVSTGVFYIGKIRVQIKINDGDVMAYYKKNYIPIDEFLDIHFSNIPRRSLSAERYRPTYETPSKPEKKNIIHAKNSSNSIEVVQDIDKLLEYSNLYKNKY